MFDAPTPPVIIQALPAPTLTGAPAAPLWLVNTSTTTEGRRAHKDRERDERDCRRAPPPPPPLLPLRAPPTPHHAARHERRAPRSRAHARAPASRAWRHHLSLSLHVATRTLHRRLSAPVPLRHPSLSARTRPQHGRATAQPIIFTRRPPAVARNLTARDQQGSHGTFFRRRRHRRPPIADRCFSRFARAFLSSCLLPQNKTLGKG